MINLILGQISYNYIAILTELYMCIITITVKPVLRGHHWNKKKWLYKTGDLLREVQFIFLFQW
jgi:hypothetical protein